MNKYVRRSLWPCLVLLIVAGLLSTSLLLHHGEAAKVHAAESTSSPSLSLNSTVLQPFELVSATAQGFNPSDTVGVYLDSANGYELGALFCDGTGTCAGSLFVPYQGVSQGNHTLLAIGSNNLQAQLAVRFIAGIKVRDAAYGTQGGPGTPLQLIGGAFQANETVQVYWASTGTGGILEGSPTTDGQGTLSFAFNAPALVAPGHYHIYVVRTGQKPATLAGSYTILHPSMVTSHIITSNQAVNVSVKGFEASEQVTVSWNANGGQVLGTFNTDETGAGQFTSNQLSTYMGTYTLTVTGVSSHITLTHTLRALAQIELSTYADVLPGSTLQVTGNGFQPNESLLVYVQLAKSAGVMVTTDTTGAFLATVAVPSYYKTPVTYPFGFGLSVYAFDTQQQKVIASTAFNLAPLVLRVSTSASSSVTYGQPMTIDAFGFAANATVKLYWDYHLPSQIILGTQQADSTGSFSITMPAPSSPVQSAGPIMAIDTSSKLTAFGSFVDLPGVILDPLTGNGGTTLHISGGSFGPTKPISIAFGSVALPPITTDKYGAFATSYVVPTPTGNGMITITVKGQTSGLPVSTVFDYLPQLKITPTSGTPGTIVTLMGQNFTTTQASIALFDPALGTSTPLGYVYLPGDGSLFDQVTLPTSGLVTGVRYELQVNDGLTAQAPFFLQTPGAQSLQVAQTLTVPGSIAEVTGSGFTPGEAVQVYFQTVTNGAVQTAADTQGNISVSLKLPTANFFQKKSYFIYAQGTTTGHSARAQILFEVPQLSSDLGFLFQYPYQFPVGMSGSGYAAGETVQLTWDYGAYGKRSAGTAITAADGTFATTVPLPSFPPGATTLNLIGRGTASGIVVTDPGFQNAVEPLAQINLSPTTTSAGTTVQISGGNFQALGAVTISVNGKTIFTGYPNTFGAFSGEYKIPANAAPQSLVITASEGSGLSASATLTIIPAITVTPPSGPVGTTSITVSGTGFTSSNTAEVWWFDPSTYQSYDLGPVTTSASGSFSETITPPEALTSGTTYTIWVTDNATGIFTVNATFTAQ